MLKLNNISVSFRNNQILTDVCLEVQPGEILSIIGHNGAGKSTLFGVIAGSIAATSGSVHLDGEDITTMTQSQRALFVGRLMQDVVTGSVSGMTVRENLCLATLKGRRATLRPAKQSFPNDVVEQILKPLNLNLENQLDIPIERLSGGQRQIIAFVMAILVKPSVLLLDEPTAALDPLSSQRLLQ